MFIALRPTEIEVVAGSSATIEVTILNPEGGSIDGLSVSFAGIEPSWVSRSDGGTVTDPLIVDGDRAIGSFVVTIPVDHPPSDRLIAIGIRSSNGDRGAAFERLPVRVVERPPVRLTTDPSIADGRARVGVSLIVSSESARDLIVVPVGADPEGAIDFEFDRSRIELPPSVDRTVGVRLRGGRPTVGRPRRRTVQLGVDAGERVLIDVPVVQRPVLSTPVLAGVSALLAVLLILVFGTTSWLLPSPTTEPAQRADDVIQVIDLDRGGASISGRVVDAVNAEPVPGLMVEAFDVADPVDAARVAATDASGVFELAGIDPGSYTVRVSGSGFASVWLGDVDRFDDASALEVAADDIELDEVTIAGEPGRILGRLSGSDLAGLVVSARPVGGGTPAVSATITGGSGGVFDLQGLVTPARHRLTVSRGDRTLTSIDVDLGPQAERGDVVIAVPAGEGVITGLVSTAAGPLGGATVVVTDGVSEVVSSSLSRGTVGAFTLEGLELPGRYTVTVTRDGFRPESVAVDLTDSQRSAQVTVELVPASGSITGRVIDVDGAGVGGVTIRATADGFDQSTMSVNGTTPSEAGRFVLDGLPAPGSFTLTFSAEGYLTRTEEITLTDPGSGPREVTASVVRSTAVISGTVRGPGGDPVSGASLVLSDGVRATTTRSATSPAGGYEFIAVSPGSYTITVRVPGAAPVVVLVEPAAGDSLTSDVTVGVSATVTGRVVSSATTTPAVPVEGATVRLFPLARFPGSTADAVATVVTGADGTFSLSGFTTPGDYVVGVSTPLAPAVVASSITVRPVAGAESVVGDIDLAG